MTVFALSGFSQNAFWLKPERGDANRWLKPTAINKNYIFRIKIKKIVLYYYNRQSSKTNAYVICKNLGAYCILNKKPGTAFKQEYKK